MLSYRPLGLRFKLGFLLGFKDLGISTYRRVGFGYLVREFTFHEFFKIGRR